MSATTARAKSRSVRLYELEGGARRIEFDAGCLHAIVVNGEVIEMDRSKAYALLAIPSNQKWEAAEDETKYLSPVRVQFSFDPTAETPAELNLREGYNAYLRQV